jgi:hypothetical protein
MAHLVSKPSLLNSSNKITTTDDGGGTLYDCKLSQLLSNSLKKQNCLKTMIYLKK